MMGSNRRLLTEAEPRHPRERSVTLVESVAGRIRPDDPTLESWYSRYSRQHVARIAADLEIVERHVAAGAHVLEYGAIPLLMTAALGTLDYTVSGVDIRPERFAAAIDDLELRVRTCNVEIEPVPYADETFDAVLFNELFEHLRINPIFTLSEARRVLKPHGTLLLSTPNLRSFRGIRNLLTRNQGHAVSPAGFAQYEKLTTLGHMGHVREYTTREVADFLTRIGFSVDKVIYRGGYGRGVVGLAERIAPSFRPFFSMVATRNG